MATVHKDECSSALRRRLADERADAERAKPAFYSRSAPPPKCPPMGNSRGSRRLAKRRALEIVRGIVSLICFGIDPEFGDPEAAKRRIEREKAATAEPTPEPAE
jgi:hypothetical protein